MLSVDELNYILIHSHYIVNSNGDYFCTILVVI